MTKAHGKLRILATTDLHAHVSNYDYYRDDVLSDVGLIGLADIIRSERAKYPNTLLLDNGDFLQGNPIGNYLRDYSLEHSHPIIQVMNELQYDVGTVGNHEFDFGIDFLEKMLRDIEHPIVNTNILKADDSHFLTPYIILERGMVTEDKQIIPLKIGITGALPPQVMLWNHKIFANYAEKHSPLLVGDILDTVEESVAKMRANGADLIIVLAHSGFSSLPYAKGAENVVQFLAEMKGVDAIIAGHAHSIFPDHIHHYDMPIVMAGSFGQYLGVIDFSLEYSDRRWSIRDTNIELKKNQNSEQQDDPLFSIIKDAHEVTIERMNTPIGKNNTQFSSALSLIQDDACIQLIADAQLWFANQLLNRLDDQYKNLPLLSAVPAFKVGGRKNAPHDFTWINEGIFTFKNVADLYPFNNQLALMMITGQEIKEWLECANSIYYQINEDKDEVQHLINWVSHRGYNRDVIKGITYHVDVRFPRRYNGDCMLINPQSERIHDLLYLGETIKNNDLFILASNQYRAYSGKFPGSGEDKVIALSMEEIPDILELYLQWLISTREEITVTPDNNWRLHLGNNKKIIYETSPDIEAYNYIESFGKSIKPLNKWDEQGFSLYIFE